MLTGRSGMQGTGMLNKTVGTPAFLAPEVCAGLPYHGTSRRQSGRWASASGCSSLVSPHLGLRVRGAAGVPCQPENTLRSL